MKRLITPVLLLRMRFGRPFRWIYEFTILLLCFYSNGLPQFFQQGQVSGYYSAQNLPCFRFVVNRGALVAIIQPGRIQARNRRRSPVRALSGSIPAGCVFPASGFNPERPEIQLQLVFDESLHFFFIQERRVFLDAGPGRTNGIAKQ